jgi:aspartate oxidase
VVAVSTRFPEFGDVRKRTCTPRGNAVIPALQLKCETTRLTIALFAVSGLSAAHTIYLAGGNVVVLDKQGFFGGNSTKATSGINGALTRTQVEHGIQDSVKQFYDDTLKSARDKARPDLIKVLTYKSAAAVEWLQDVFNLDLTLVSRLG